MTFFRNLFDALSRPRLADPVEGTAQVVSASMPPYKSGGGGMCVMNLVVTVPGQPSVAVRKASLVRLAHWPMPGTVLPVLAERNDPRRFRILWDRVPSGAERGARQAEEVASRMNGVAPGAQAGAFRAGSPVRVASSITINGQPASAEAIAAVEALTGMDLDGDGQVGGKPAPGTGYTAGEAGESIEARLRHLQKLRDDGLVSAEEYRAKRAEILAGL